MRRGRITKHNPLPPPDQFEYIQLAPGQVKEALEAYDQWTDKQRVPPIVKELKLVLSIEVDRLESRP